jgi:hypothetical protein
MAPFSVETPRLSKTLHFEQRWYCWQTEVGNPSFKDGKSGKDGSWKDGKDGFFQVNPVFQNPSFDLKDGIDGFCKRWV